MHRRKIPIRLQLPFKIRIAKIVKSKIVVRKKNFIPVAFFDQPRDRFRLSFIRRRIDPIKPQITTVTC